jgi:hypothetical protein
MSLVQLRKHVQDNYLNNNIISGREARELVKKGADGALTAASKADLETLRAEFKDSFSAAGLREFDRAMTKATSQAGLGDYRPPVDSDTSAVSVFSGRNLAALPTSFKLSEVTDADVRKLLRRMDLNVDGKVDTKDRDKLGLDDNQFRMFVFSALLLGKEIDEGQIFPTDLSGKKVCFSAVPDKDEARAMAEAMGAVVVSDVREDVDFVVVGEDRRTGKDERALALNTLGVADIGVGRWANFLKAAEDAGVTGGTPADGLSPAAYEAKRDTFIHGWWRDYVMNSWDYELENTTGAERDRALEMRETDLHAYDNGLELVEDEYTEEDIDERYEWSDMPYTDRFGVEVPRDAIEVIALSMFPEFAGIGLSVTFAFDKRTGEVLEEFDVMD